MSRAPSTIGSVRSKPAPVCDHVAPEKNSDWISVPATRPLTDSTTDQPIQYPNVASGPISVRYLRHASCAYSATPPDLFGNMHASSAWMLFCSAPRQIEIVHNRNAPVVPRAPIDRPSEAMRKPGFASATTNPSHHVMALRSCLSSTWAVATASPPPPTPAGERAYSEQIGPSRAARLYHVPRSGVNRSCAFSPSDIGGPPGV